ncbi:hypothetical protein OAA38_00820 [bacterium]|nr:hypothetical protein [bacterium]
MAKDDFKVKKGLVVGKGIVADSAVRASAFIGDGSQLTNLDYNDISSNLPTILDSAAVNSLITVADTHDSAAVVGQIDSDYIELRRPAESVFAVVNNGSGAYRYSGDGFPLQSGNNPSLYLTRGKTYKFAVNASGHPFWIQTSSGAYNSGNVLSDSDGVTNNGQQSGNVFYTVPMTAPTQLYYVCQYHSAMNGNIYIDKAVGVDSAAVNSLISAADTHDSSATQSQIDSAVTISFINGLSGTLDAARIPTLTLGTDTNGNYVQSTTAGLGIKSLSAAGESVDQTISVDSGFVTGLFSAAEGISYSGGVIGLDATDSATFANVTVTNEFAVFDSANGEEVAKFAGDPSTGLTIHSHAHATDGGIRFVIHNTADSDYLILSQPTGISAVNRRIRNVGAPTSDKDAATKSYVDGVAQGLAIRDPAKAATTAALTSTNDITAFAYDSGALGFGAKILITATTGLDSVDGYTLQSGDRLMVKNETGNNLPFNGIYNWDSAKGLTRTTDMDSGSEFNGGEFVFVQEGTINGGNGFSQKDNVTTLGQDAVHFVQFSGAGQITAGNGIAKSGNTLSVDVASSSGLTGTGGGGSQLSIDLEGTSLELTSGGIRVSQQGSQGIGLQELNLENGGITLAAIAAGDASETFATATLRNQLESGIYKVYTSTIGDSDTRALVDSDYVRLRADSDYIKTVTGFANGNLTNSSVTVIAGKGLLNGGSVALGSSVTLNIDSSNIQGFIDSAYIRPLARAAIVAGSNITYDSATGVIASTASGGSGTSSSFTVALGLLDSTSRAGTDIPSALGVGDPVFYDSDAGYWTGAKADSASTASHVIVEFSTSNSNFKIAQTGVFTLDSNSGSPTFVDNSYYYLSDSSGVPTPTQPTLGVFQALYYALDSDTIDINLGDPVELSLGKTDIEQFPNVVGGNTTLSLTQAINTARTDVYKNGILLQEGATSDYVISSSTQITLNDAPDDSDVFSVRSMVPVGTLNTATTVITGSTAAAPNPAVQGDTNTGLFSAAADTLSITTGGSERLKATNSGVEVTGTLTASTISGGPTIDSATISGELTMTGGPGIPKNTSLTDAATINFNIDSGNTGTLSFALNRTLVVGVTGGASMSPYVGTSFTILAFNSHANSDRTLTVQAASGDTLYFNSTNVVTVNPQKMAVISGMVFNAEDVVLSSVSLDSSLTF